MTRRWEGLQEHRNTWRDTEVAGKRNSHQMVGSESIGLHSLAPQTCLSRHPHFSTIKSVLVILDFTKTC